MYYFYLFLVRVDNSDRFIRPPPRPRGARPQKKTPEGAPVGTIAAAFDAQNVHRRFTEPV